MLAAATILGSGGFVPTGTRETSSVLLLPAADDDAAVVIDAGTGLRRLITDRDALLGGRSRLEVLLTHFHIDHICGLAYLTELTGIAITVRGPGAELYDMPTATALQRLFAPPIMPVDLEQLGVAVGELPVGALDEDDGLAGALGISTRRQDRHTNPTLGIRVGDALTWCTDTEDDPLTVAFARGSRVLAHDAWGPPVAPGHAEPAAAAQVAVDAGCEQLVLIHVPPMADETALHGRAAAVHGAVTVATDGLDLLAL
ncbi:Ribonuclease BN [Baekduia alba]|uniref:MBL fold metallo-hydrolase n=1 Tax=Baekduia alba TaxID=2997333 RepID=UPI002342524A|nr:MBL fold metallo-hydrolase [Baekduia alba]WCB96643.1 Ribonuclease BN [Baekduia alba]